MKICWSKGVQRKRFSAVKRFSAAMCRVEGSDGETVTSTSRSVFDERERGGLVGSRDDGLTSRWCLAASGSKAGLNCWGEE